MKTPMPGSPSRVGGLRPALRTIAVRGGPVDSDAFCEQALRALHAEVSDQPQVVFEAYLAHLRSCGAHLTVSVEAPAALPPATLAWLARWTRGPESALRVVAAGELPERDAPAAAQREGVRPVAEPRAPAPSALPRRRRAWAVVAVGLVAVLASLLLWSRAGDEAKPPTAVAENAPEVATPTLDPAPGPPPEGGDPGEPAAEAGADPASDAPLPEATPLDEALAALEAGDADAYKRALRSVDGPAAGQAEAQLLRRLGESRSEGPTSERSERMLAAWGLALVGGRDALATLDAAAGDADRHVAAVAARSAAVIRARLAAGGSDAGPPVARSGVRRRRSSGRARRGPSPERGSRRASRVARDRGAPQDSRS